MKILVVNWRCIKNPEMGGAEIHLHEIFRRLAENGHEITLVCHSFPGAKKEEIIDKINIVRHGNKFLFDKQFKSYYKNCLMQKDYDLIVDDISKVPLKVPKYANKPVVGILHHIHGESLYKEIPFPLAYYIIQNEKRIPQNYGNTPIFTVSESTREELINLGYNKEKIDILYNAIDHNLFDSVEPEKADFPLITYIGRIKNYKNIDKIIDAIAIVRKEIPNIKFIIGGKGDQTEALKQKVKKLNLSGNIDFKGFLTEDEKAEILGNAWLFVTMAEKEGWGITVLEANAMKTPVIGSDVEGLRDSIKDNETGYLVPLNDVNTLSSKIVGIIKDKNELRRLGENAKKWSGNFSWDKSAEHFLKQSLIWFPQLKNKL